MSEQDTNFGEGWLFNASSAVFSREEKEEFKRMPHNQRLCVISLLLHGRAIRRAKDNARGRRGYHLRMTDPKERERHRLRVAKARANAPPGHEAKLRRAYFKRSLQARLAAKGRCKIHGIYRGVVKRDKYVVPFLGCTRDEFLKHIESQFSDGMSWGNYGFGDGRWVTDHIRPVASFDLSDPEQYRICFNHTNLRPVWCKDNIRKSSYYNGVRCGKKRQSLAVLPPKPILPVI